MRRSCACLSPKLKVSGHPKNAVHWKPGTSGFWKPKYGASKMKWNFNVPYVREVDSLHHYPAISRVTGKQINWYQDEPEDGYRGARLFGEHTLELKGMPFGRTPEYMQERLRRFFSKFGPVMQCRADPHPMDPYQCDGTAFVTFRDKQTALRALRAPLKFPASLHDKIVSMRHIDSDKKNDPNYFEKAKFWNVQLLAVARQLHMQLSRAGEYREEGKPLRLAGFGVLEKELVAEEWHRATRGRAGVPHSKGLVGAPTRLVPAGPAVRRRFGSWERFLAEAPFDELFRLELGQRTAGTGTGAEAGMDDGPQAEAAEGLEAEAPPTASDVVIRPRLVSTTQRARILAKARMVLERRLHEEFSVWWREGKIALPEYTQRRVDWWDHKPALPFDIQIMSRSKDRHRIFDEKFLYRRQMTKARNAQRNERRAEYMEERRKLQEERRTQKDARQSQALEAVERARCAKLLGQGLVPGSASAQPKVRPQRPQ